MCNPNRYNSFKSKGTMFIASNDNPAKKIVSKYIKKFGWDVSDVGSLNKSHHLESLAILYGNISMNMNWNTDFIFSLSKSDTKSSTKPLQNSSINKDDPNKSCKESCKNSKNNKNINNFTSYQLIIIILVCILSFIFGSYIN